MSRQFAILISLSAASLCATRMPAQQVDPYEAALRAAEIEPTKEGIANYFISLVPNEANQQRAEQLVKQLGDASFTVREQAEIALSNMPNPPLELLERASQSNDPEVRYRARSILTSVEQGGAKSVTNAAFGYITRNELKGLAFPLLQYLPYSAVTSAFGSASQAIQATVTKDDLPLLRRAIERKHATRRAIAVQALAKVQGEAAADELMPLLEHEDAIVQLAAAQSLANLGRREALSRLVALLDAEELEVRSHSAGVLRNFTHEHFQYVAYDQTEARAAAVDRWRKWLASDGKTAPLHFPLTTMRRFLGRTLISMYPKTLREIDAGGNALLEVGGFQYVWGCHANADGVRVVADFSKKLLIEFDAAGKESLRLNGLPGPPSDVRRLESGNFLLALADTDKVVEMDREGRIVWSVALEGRPTSINRLENGNSLVNLQFGKRVIEIDSDGKVVWELTGINNALTAQALPNGNVLVCEMNQGKAVEYNRAGRIVWEKRGFHNACQAQRLPNGNTLVSDSKGLHEFDATGEKVWNLEVPRGRFWRY